MRWLAMTHYDFFGGLVLLDGPRSWPKSARNAARNPPFVLREVVMPTQQSQTVQMPGPEILKLQWISLSRENLHDTMAFALK